MFSIKASRLIIALFILALVLGAPISGLAATTIGPNINTGGTVTANTFTDGVLTITSGAITGASGNISQWTNDSSYITGITGLDVTTALGFTPYDATNPASYISGITGLDVTTALGFTPYDASNPAGYLTSYTETDPIYSGDPAAGITGLDITAWNTAVQPGDNVSTLTNDAGYLTSYTETDPQVNTLTANQWCTADGTGTAINCTSAAPSVLETDPIVKAINGLVKSNGTTISAASAGTDYLAPGAIGSTVQAWDTDLDSWAALTPPANAVGVLTNDGAGNLSWGSTGSGTVTSVSGSGGTTGLTLSGGPITTSGTLTLGGTLAVSNGGTGQTTALAAFNALSPLSTSGDILYYNGTNNVRLAAGTAGQVLTISGGVPTWAALKSIIGGSSSVTINADRYMTYSFSSATDNQVSIPLPYACTARNLYVVTSADVAAAGNSVIMTVRKNGAPTALTCTITGAAGTETTCSDTTNTASFAAGDLWDLFIDEVGTITAVYFKFGFECD